MLKSVGVSYMPWEQDRPTSKWIRDSSAKNIAHSVCSFVIKLLFLLIFIQNGSIMCIYRKRGGKR